MRVPILDLNAQYNSIKDEVDHALRAVLESGWFVGGDPVRNFENEFAAAHSVPHCIGCGNGTDALEILLKAMGIGPGDEVIVPALTWISTAEAVSSVGAKPVFVDIEPIYFSLDVLQIEQKITHSTKAIIPVHLYGHPADMPAIMAIAEQYRLLVIEDCAQAHFAAINSKRVGCWGHAAAFSFYPTKNLGAYGDGGCMLVREDGLAERVRRLANHGQLKKNDHPFEGRNSRLDTLQAAVLSVKLRHLAKWNELRILRAARYHYLLKNSSFLLPQTRKDALHVFHLFVIRIKNRASAIQYLRDHGIETAVHYPCALPFLPAYNSYGFKKNDFPAAARVQEEVLSLPMYSEISDEAIDYVGQHLMKLDT